MQGTHTTQRNPRPWSKRGVLHFVAGAGAGAGVRCSARWTRTEMSCQKRLVVRYTASLMEGRPSNPAEPGRLRRAQPAREAER